MRETKFNPLPDPVLQEKPPRLRPSPLPMSQEPPVAAPAVDPDGPVTEVQGPGNFNKGFVSGVQGLRASAHGLAAAAGTAVGANEFAEGQLQQAEIANYGAQGYTPEITDINNIKDVGDIPTWFAGVLGQSVPSMAAIAAGGLTGLGVKGVAKLGVKKGTAATAGAIATSSGLSTGNLFTELVGDEQARENHSNKELAAIALGGGVASGTVDALPILNMFKRFGMQKSAQRSIGQAVRDHLKAGGKQALEEGGAEGVQTVIERATKKFANDNIEIFGEEGRNEILNAIAAGAAAGGTVGTLFGQGHGGLRDRIEQKEADAELSGKRDSTTLDALKNIPAANEELQQNGEPDLNTPEGREKLNEMVLRFEQDFVDTLGEEKAKSLLGKNEAVIKRNQNDLLILRDVGRDPGLLKDEKVRASLQDINTRFDKKDMQAVIDYQRQREDLVDEETLFDVVERARNDKSEGLSSLYQNSETRDSFAEEGSKYSEGSNNVSQLTAPKSIFHGNPKANTVSETATPAEKRAAKKKLGGYLKPELTEALTGKRYETSAIDKQLGTLRENFPDATIEKVSLKQALAGKYKSEGRTQGGITYQLRADGKAEFNRLLTQYEGKPEQQERLRAMFDEKNPDAFLDKLEVIQDDRAISAIAKADENALSDMELYGGKGSFGKGIIEGDQFYTDAKGKKRRASRASHIPVLQGGELSGQNVVMHRLVSRMWKNSAEYNKNTEPSMEQLRSAFSAARVALDERGVEVAKDAIRAHTPVYYSDNKPVYYAELMAKGDGKKEQLKARIQAIRSHITESVSANTPKDLIESLEKEKRNAEYRYAQYLGDAEKLSSKAESLMFDIGVRQGQANDPDYMARTGNAPAKELREHIRKAERFLRSVAKEDAKGNNAVNDLQTIVDKHKPLRTETPTANAEEGLESMNATGPASATPALEGKASRILANRKKLTAWRETLNKLGDNDPIPAEIKQQFSRVKGAKTAADYVDHIEAVLDSQRRTLYKLQYENSKNRDDILKFSDDLEPNPELDQAIEQEIYDRIDRAFQDADGLDYAPLHEQVAAWNKDTGLDITVESDPATYLKKLRKSFPDLQAYNRMVTRLLEGRSAGFYNVQTNSVVVSPKLQKDRATEVLAHEYGHGLFQQSFLGLVAEQSDVANKIIRDFEAWRDTFRDAAPSARTVFGTKRPEVAAKRLMEASQGLGQATPAQQAYMLDFNEWFADQVARGLTRKGSATRPAQTFFARLAESLKRLYDSLRGNANYNAAPSVRKFIDQVFAAKKSNVLIRANQQSQRQIFDSLVELRKAGKIKSESVGLGAYLVEQVGRPLSNDKQVRDILDSMRYDDEASSFVGGSVNEGQNPFSRSAFDELRAGIWSALSDEERRVLTRTFSSARLRENLISRIREQDADFANSLEHDFEGQIVAAYMFWKAGEISVGPATQTVFERLGSLIRDVFSVVSEQDQAVELLNAMRSGLIAERAIGQNDFAIKKTLSDTTVSRFGQKASEIWDKTRFLPERALGIAESRLYDSKNPALIEIAQRFNARVGKTKIKRTMYEARRVMMGRFMKQRDAVLQRIQDEGGEALMNEVLEKLQNPSMEASDNVTAYAREIHKLLRNIHGYVKDKGLELGDRGRDYFPWKFNAGFMQQNAQNFKALILQDNYQDHVNSLVAESLGRPQSRASQVTQAEREAFADMVINGIINQEGLADLSMDAFAVGHTPAFKNLNERKLQFLYEAGSAQDREALASYFDKNLGNTLQVYIKQAVKRAEYTERFGKYGAELHKLLLQAEQSGASQYEMENARMYIDAMMGTLGSKTNQHMRLFGVNMKRLFGRISEAEAEAQKGQIRSETHLQVINPVLREAMGAAMVIQNVALLGLATFTSLADVHGIGVRSSDMRIWWRSMKAGAAEIKNAVKGDESELHALAQSLGVIETSLTNEALEYEYGSTYLSATSKKINEVFFKTIMLTQWTNLTRVAALSGGREFLAKHADGTHNEHSLRYLEQLGLKPGDVQLDENGQVKLLPTENNATAEEKARDERVRTALYRFVDEATLRPNGSQRPLYGSDPHFMLVYHLKAFMYAFHDRILRRMVTEAAAGNISPMVLTLSLYPASLLITDMVRTALTTGGETPEWQEEWGVSDYAWQSIRRSGVLGLGNMIVDSGYDVKFGGNPFESLAGPTADSLSMIDDLLFDADKGRGAALLRHMPYQNVWKHYAEDAGLIGND